MNAFTKWMKTLLVATVNICLQCGAQHAIDWVGFVFSRTSHAGRKIKNLVLNRL